MGQGSAHDRCIEPVSNDQREAARRLKICLEYLEREASQANLVRVAKLLSAAAVAADSSIAQD